MLAEQIKFDYQLIKSPRRKSVAIQIKGGEVWVRAPQSCDENFINTLLISKQAWVLKHLAQSRQTTVPDWIGWKTLPLQGLFLQLNHHIATKSRVIFSSGQLCVSVSSRVSAERYQLVLRQQIQQWYRQQALCWFTERTRYWQEKMQLHVGHIHIGNWKGKWGYCRDRTELGFNWRLMMAPDWVADYVIVHELAHIRHMNHSADYWALVRRYYPELENAKQWLRDNQHQLLLQ